MPVHLAAQASTAIDIGMLIAMAQPDANGNLIPNYIQEGSVVFSNPKGPKQWMTLAVCGAFYNPSKATCGESCVACYGYSNPEVEADPFSVAVTGTVQLNSQATYADGSVDYFTASSSWASGNTPVATVGASTGLVAGVSPGSVPITAAFPLLVVYTGEICTEGCPVPCPTGILGGGSSGSVCSLSISSPANGQVFSLGGGNYNSATIPLEAASACTGAANWTLLFNYTSTAGVPYSDTEVTTSTIGQTSNYNTVVGDGGEVFLTASALLAGQQFSVGETVYVDGTTIPNATITSRLVGLYSGATTGLLTGIAWVESSYQQFVSRSLYQVPGGLWPNESPSPALGQYVGLMQVPNGLPPAFNWITNTSNGASIFNGKYSTVQSYVSNLQSQHSSLPNLSGSQYEDNQLILYGGYWTSNSSYYWVPNSTYTGWVKNTSSAGYSYVNNVRNDIQ